MTRAGLIFPVPTYGRLVISGVYAGRGDRKEVVEAELDALPGLDLDDPGTGG